MIIEKLGITPGPWGCHKDGYRIVSTKEKLHGVDRFVAKAYTDTKMVYQTMAANTTLIAAAPEMLEALICLHNDAVELCSTDYEYVESVIEKATGKTWEEIKALKEEE